MKLVAASLNCDIRTELHPVFVQEEVDLIVQDAEAPVKQQLLEDGGNWIEPVLLAVDGAIPVDVSFSIVKVSHSTCWR